MALTPEEIRAAYAEAPMSQRALAEKLGVSRSQVQRALDPDASRRNYWRNRENILAGVRAWRDAHPEYREVRARREREKRRADPAYAAVQAAKNRAWRVANPERAMCTSARLGAKQRGLSFDLVPADIVIPDVCPVYGTRLSRDAFGRQNDSPSLDRVDNTKGYTRDNVRVISWEANRDKRDLSIDKLLALAEYVLNHKAGV